MIKFLVMDVDGTLTDGKVYIGNEGEFFKAFSIKDGCGILHVQKAGIIPIIITGRKSQILLNRCKELGITEIHQGIKDKLDCLYDILANHSTENCTYTLKNVAYAGDDILDLDCLRPISEAGGLAACPSDAIPEVISACNYVAPHKGGEGAVRDLTDFILSSNKDNTNYPSLHERINSALQLISSLDFKTLTLGRHDVDEEFYYVVQEYESFDETVSIFESHKKHIDIQWVFEGHERLYVTDVKNLKAKSYDSEHDVVLYEKANSEGSLILQAGSCAILMPEDAHRPSSFLNDRCIVKKVVGKLLINNYQI